MDGQGRHLLTRRSAWAISALWMGVIFGLSSLPGSAVPSGASTYGHLIVYAILGVLLFGAFLHETPNPPRALAYAVLLASFYGVTDEIHQAFVPGRVPDVADWGVDTLGALGGAWLAYRLMRSTGTAAPGQDAQ